MQKKDGLLKPVIFLLLTLFNDCINEIVYCQVYYDTYKAIGSREILIRGEKFCRDVDKYSQGYDQVKY